MAAYHWNKLTSSSYLCGTRLLGALLAVVLLLPSAPAQAQRPQLQLDLQPPTGSSDPTTIYFEAGATTGLDANFDAEKIFNSANTDPNLASIAQTQVGEYLVINGLPPSVLTSSYTVNLFVGVPQDGVYTLRVSQLVNFTSNQLFLTDALLNTSVLLTPSTVYSFYQTKFNTNGSYGTSTRFALLFEPTSGPLPVTLTDFTAQAQPPGVALTWHTASELHSAYFAVERSADGKSFTELGRVAAAGTSSQAHAYTFSDPLPQPGTGYYRLRQVDLDGSFTYSPVRVVAGPLAAQESLVFPNPASAGSTLQWLGTGEQVQVLNTLGQVVAVAQTVATGTLVLPAGLPSGLYIVRGGQQTARLLVK